MGNKAYTDEDIIKNRILGVAIKNNGVSLDVLVENTGLSSQELFPLIEQLMQEGKIILLPKEIVGQDDRYRSRQEEIFFRFIDLLSTHIGERNIRFYADRLCISAKYLSVVVKQVSGRVPTAWIKEQVIREIKYRLCRTQQSVKEIAYELNFPNASFFGKYFKQETGMSPFAYRTKYINHNHKM